MEMAIQDPGVEADLILIDLAVADRWEAIDRLTALLLAKGYVRASYLDKVKERERDFPSGLPTEPVAIAIPHTWAEHCLRPAVAVGILARPVPWLEMATLDHLLDVRVVLLLSIPEPKQQAGFLRALIDYCTGEGNLARLLEQRRAEDVRRLLEEGLRHEQEAAPIA